MNELPEKPAGVSAGWILAVLVLLTVVLAGAWFVFKGDGKTEKTGKTSAVEERRETREPRPSGRLIDYDRMGEEKGGETSDLMAGRKEKYGVDDSLDMIVTEEDSIKVGEDTVTMREILEKVRLSENKILEKDLSPKSVRELASPDEYGIYVVRARDNIWNIHFRLLKEYFDRKGVMLSPLSDEPVREGQSSGIGKILKFSENMVHIYNLTTRTLENDLDVIQPGSKVVVYSMTDVFDLLDQINTGQVNLIRFDGDTLWLPAQQ